MEKRHRGRPRKKEGSIAFWQFVRAAIAMSAYDAARQNGEKHSSAVRHAVDYLKLCSQEMPVSETEVKRILSTFRPRGSGTILRFEPSTLSKEDIKINRWIRKQSVPWLNKTLIKFLEPPVYDEKRSVTKLTVRLADRPNYPRHNGKLPKE